MTTPSEPTGRQLRATWRNGHNAKRSRCGRCKENVATVGITQLVYTFEKCDCSIANYDHLVEQLWHRNCFVLGSPPLAAASKAAT